MSSAHAPALLVGSGDARTAPGIAFMQGSGHAAPNGTVTVTAPVAGGVHAGDLVIVAADWDSTTGAITDTLTDSQGNTYLDAVPAATP